MASADGFIGHGEDSCGATVKGNRPYAARKHVPNLLIPPSYAVSTAGVCLSPFFTTIGRFLNSRLSRPYNKPSIFSQAKRPHVIPHVLNVFEAFFLASGPFRHLSSRADSRARLARSSIALRDSQPICKLSYPLRLSRTTQRASCTREAASCDTASLLADQMESAKAASSGA